MTNFMAHCHFGATHIKLQKSCVDSANPSISLRWWQLVDLRAVILYAEVILFILIHSYKEYLTSFHVIARVYPIYDQTAPRPPKQQTVRYCILKDKNLHQTFFFLYSRLLILNSMKLNKPYQLQGGNIFLLSNKVLTSSVQTRHTQRAGKSFSLKAFSIFLCFWNILSSVRKKREGRGFLVELCLYSIRNLNISAFFVVTNSTQLIHLLFLETKTCGRGRSY